MEHITHPHALPNSTTSLARAIEKPQRIFTPKLFCFTSENSNIQQLHNNKFRAAKINIKLADCILPVTWGNLICLVVFRLKYLFFCWLAAWHFAKHRRCIAYLFGYEVTMAIGSYCNSYTEFNDNEIIIILLSCLSALMQHRIKHWCPSLRMGERKRCQCSWYLFNSFRLNFTCNTKEVHATEMHIANPYSHEFIGNKFMDCS